MKDTFSFSLEKLVSKDREHSETMYRGFVWKTLHHGYRPVTLVHDIGEGTLADLNAWLCNEHSYVTHVRHADGTLDEPDCLTVFEAAEAMAL